MFLFANTNIKILVVCILCNMPIEDNIKPVNKIDQLMQTGATDNTFMDKLLAKNIDENLRALIKKDKLERADLREILYLLGSQESKLLNYSEWDRYIQLKFFVWVREFVKSYEVLYDYEEDIKKYEKAGKLILSERSKKLLENNERTMSHIAKFLIDLYLNVARTTLSLGATGMLEFLKNKFEIVYPQKPVVAENKGFNFMGLKIGG